MPSPLDYAPIAFIPTYPMPHPASTSTFNSPTTTRHVLRRPRRHAVASPQRFAPHASSTPAPSTSPPPPPTSPAIPGTPCFTPDIIVSPMPLSHRTVYLDAAADATDRFITALRSSDAHTPPLSTVGQISLLPPQLNPELDVYDRRFLLQLTWAVLDVTANAHGLRTRVLIQGTGSFGAIPLSVAGLRRNFDADVAASADAWADGIIQTGDLERVADLTDEDEAIIVVSPTNTVSGPVVDDLIGLVKRAAGRPLIVLNPRLADVPSSSGVMQVVGRAERIQFLQSFSDVFYLRLLYSSGTMYPVRGILYHSFPEPWQIWRSEDSDNHFRLIGSTSSRPSTDQITEAFSKDKYAQQKKIMQEARESGSLSSVDELATSPAVLAALGLTLGVGALQFFGTDLQGLLHMFGKASSP